MYIVNAAWLENWEPLKPSYLEQLYTRDVRIVIWLFWCRGHWLVTVIDRENGRVVTYNSLNGVGEPEAIMAFESVINVHCKFCSIKDLVASVAISQQEEDAKDSGIFATCNIFNVVKGGGFEVQIDIPTMRFALASRLTRFDDNDRYRCQDILNDYQRANSVDLDKASRMFSLGKQSLHQGQGRVVAQRISQFGHTSAQLGH